MAVFEQEANMTTAIKSRTLTELTKFTSYNDVIVDHMQGTQENLKVFGPPRSISREDGKHQR